MSNQCTACNVEITAEDIVVCCEGCACLHDNIFWMCDACKNVIEKGRLRDAMKEVKNYATITELNLIKK